MFDAEGETSKLYQQDYISQNTISKKNLIYPETKSLFTISTVLGIIGSLICIIAVFLPFYDQGYGIARTVISDDTKIIPTEYLYEAHNVLYFPFFVTAVTVLTIMLADNFSIINDLFKALLLFLLIPLFWWMLFRVFAHERSHLGITSKYLVVCGFKRLTLKTYYIPFDKIQCVKITQSIPQKISGTCNIQVYLYFENRALHTVKHIPLDKAKTLLSHKKIHFF